MIMVVSFRTDSVLRISYYGYSMARFNSLACFPSTSHLADPDGVVVDCHTCGCSQSARKRHIRGGSTWSSFLISDGSRLSSARRGKQSASVTGAGTNVQRSATTQLGDVASVEKCSRVDFMISW